MLNTYLVLDTNALPTTGNFTSGFWKALFRLCAVKGVTPAISEVTLAESQNMRKRSAEALLKQLVASHDKLSRLTRMESLYTPDGDAIFEEQGKRLRELFQVLPLSGTDAIESLRREALRIVPARLGQGGRDAAIWLTIAGLANAGNTVYFVTNNHKDFGKGGLFAGLRSEVVDAPVPIQYFATPNAFVSQIATKISVPILAEDSVAEAFSDSLRSRIIEAIEVDGSSEHTVDRTYSAQLSFDDVTLGDCYQVDEQGIVYCKAKVHFVDEDGVQWVSGKMSGWLNFEIADSRISVSEVDTFEHLTFT